MDGHQSSSQRSSPTDADHLQRITALTVNVGKISKSNNVQSSSANQRSAQNTTNSASGSGSSDPILAMEKLVKSRIPNSSTSRSWKNESSVMNHRFGANCKSNNGAFNLTFIDLTMQVSYLTQTKTLWTPYPMRRVSNIIWDLQSKPNQIFLECICCSTRTFSGNLSALSICGGVLWDDTPITNSSQFVEVIWTDFDCITGVQVFWIITYESFNMGHPLSGHLQISFLAHTSSKTSLHLKTLF